VANKRRHPVWTALLILSALFLIVGCSSREEKVVSFVTRGDRLMQKGDPAHASLEYKNALQIDPRSKDAILGLGKALLALKEYRQAYSLYVVTLAASPDMDEVRLQLAWLFTLARQGERAIEQLALLQHPDKSGREATLIKAVALLSLKRYREVVDTLAHIEGGESDKNVQMVLARAHVKLKDWQGAEKAAQRWRALAPGEIGPYLFLAQVEVERKHDARAEVELQQMVAANPKDLQRPILQAQTLEALGLSKQAEAAFERLPERRATLQAKADFWRRGKNPAKERAALKKLAALSPVDVDAVIRLAQLDEEQNDQASAMAVVDSGLQTGLKKADRQKMILAKATLLAMQAKFTDAMTQCRTLLSEDQSNMDAQLLLGKILLSLDRPADAEIHLSQAAASRPENVEAQIFLARSQFMSKKEALAVLTLNKGLEKVPGSVPLRLELIRYYIGKNQVDLASNLIDTGLKIHPDDISLLKTRGAFQASRKDYSGAETSLHRIVSLQPNSPAGYLALGRLMIVEAKYREAVQWFRQALEKVGGRESALASLVEAYILQKDTPSALALLKEESRSHPESATVHYYIGLALETAHDSKGAEAAFLRASELAPRWLPPYKELAGLKLREGDVDGAISKFEQAYQQKPADPVLFQLAMLYELAGRYGDAIRACGQLVDKSAGGPELMNDLAYLYLEHGTDDKSREKAQGLISRALAKEPGNPFFLDTAAWADYRKGDLNGAWYNIQRALADNPDIGLHWMHAAIILHAQGREKEALTYLEKALRPGGDPKLYKEARELKKEWASPGRGSS
jgi:tetratricopeptide (TPR) repeat protein